MLTPNYYNFNAKTSSKWGSKLGLRIQFSIQRALYRSFTPLRRTRILRLARCTFRLLGGHSFCPNLQTRNNRFYPFFLNPQATTERTLSCGYKRAIFIPSTFIPVYFIAHWLKIGFWPKIFSFICKFVLSCF